MHGDWAFYRKDGSLMRSGSFDRGAQVGVWRTFDRGGHLVKETRFPEPGLRRQRRQRKAADQFQDLVAVRVHLGRPDALHATEGRGTRWLDVGDGRQGLVVGDDVRRDRIGAGTGRAPAAERREQRIVVGDAVGVRGRRLAGRPAGALVVREPVGQLGDPVLARAVAGRRGTGSARAGSSGRGSRARLPTRSHRWPAPG